MEIIFLIGAILTGFIGYRMGEVRDCIILGTLLGACFGLIGLLLILFIPKK